MHSEGDTTTNKGKRTVQKLINKDTLLPLGLVLTIILGVRWLDNNLNEIKLEQVKQGLRLGQIEKQIAISVGDRWRRADMHHWVSLFEKGNPGLDVPAAEPLPRSD